MLGGTVTEEEGGVVACPAVATADDAGESGCDGCMEEMSRDSVVALVLVVPVHVMVVAEMGREVEGSVVALVLVVVHVMVVAVVVNTPLTLA